MRADGGGPGQRRAEVVFGSRDLSLSRSRARPVSSARQPLEEEPRSDMANGPNVPLEGANRGGFNCGYLEPREEERITRARIVVRRPSRRVSVYMRVSVRNLG